MHSSFQDISKRANARLANNCLVGLFMGLLFSSVPIWAKPASPTRPPAVVSSLSVQSVVHRSMLRETGTVVAVQGVSLAPQIGGRVSQLFFQSGQMVKQGDAILALDAKVIEAAVAKDQATERAAKQDYERMQVLHRQHAVSMAKLEDAQVAWQSAKAALVGDQATRDQMMVRAPFAGRLGIRQVSVGDYLTPGQIITKLESVDPILVRFSVPEQLVKQVTVGRDVQVYARAYPKQAFVGVIKAKDSVVDLDTRMLTVQAQLANPEGKLLPGMFVRVELDIGTGQPIVAVPQTAIVYSKDANAVYKIDAKNIAHLTPVTLGQRFADQVEIANGLAVGDHIVVAGQNKLMDGALVKPVPQDLH